MIALLMLLFCGIAHGAMVIQRDYVQETRSALAIISSQQKRAARDKGLWEIIDIIDKCPEEIAPEVAQLIGDALVYTAGRAGDACFYGTVQFVVIAPWVGAMTGVSFCGVGWAMWLNAATSINVIIGACSCGEYVKYKKADKKLYNFLSKYNALPAGYQKNCAERACPCI